MDKFNSLEYLLDSKAGMTDLRLNILNCANMKFLSLEPFVPSGGDFEGAKQLFQELGFKISWDAGDYTGFEKDGCKFILQKYDKPEFAKDFMVNVGISHVKEYRDYIIEKKLTEQFPIRIGPVIQQPYGKEVNIIDMAGVCWHFVEQREA